MLGVLGKVILAALLRDTIGLSEGVDIRSESAIAAPTSLAVDHDLWREGNIRPGAIAGDVDAIGDGGGTALCPAAAAVDRDVLVLRPREVVDP